MNGARVRLALFLALQWETGLAENTYGLKKASNSTGLNGLSSNVKLGLRTRPISGSSSRRAPSIRKHRMRRRALHARVGHSRVGGVWNAVEGWATPLEADPEDDSVSLLNNAKRMGITKSHLKILQDFSNTYKLVLVIRPSEVDTMLLIDNGFGTKSVDVHNKSSNWGPMAGSIPVDVFFNKKQGTRTPCPNNYEYVTDAYDESDHVLEKTLCRPDPKVMEHRTLDLMENIMHSPSTEGMNTHVGIDPLLLPVRWWTTLKEKLADEELQSVYHVKKIEFEDDECESVWEATGFHKNEDGEDDERYPWGVDLDKRPVRFCVGPAKEGFHAVSWFFGTGEKTPLNVWSYNDVPITGDYDLWAIMPHCETWRTLKFHDKVYSFEDIANPRDIEVVGGHSDMSVFEQDLVKYLNKATMADGRSRRVFNHGPEMNNYWFLQELDSGLAFIAPNQPGTTTGVGGITTGYYAKSEFVSTISTLITKGYFFAINPLYTFKHTYFFGDTGDTGLTMMKSKIRKTIVGQIMRDSLVRLANVKEIISKQDRKDAQFVVQEMYQKIEQKLQLILEERDTSEDPPKSVVLTYGNLKCNMVREKLIHNWAKRVRDSQWNNYVTTVAQTIEAVKVACQVLMAVADKDVEAVFGGFEPKFYALTKEGAKFEGDLCYLPWYQIQHLSEDEKIKEMDPPEGFENAKFWELMLHAIKEAKSYKDLADTVEPAMIEELGELIEREELLKKIRGKEMLKINLEETDLETLRSEGKGPYLFLSSAVTAAVLHGEESNRIEVQRPHDFEGGWSIVLENQFVLQHEEAHQAKAESAASYALHLVKGGEICDGTFALMEVGCVKLTRPNVLELPFEYAAKSSKIVSKVLSEYWKADSETKIADTVCPEPPLVEPPLVEKTSPSKTPVEKSKEEESPEVEEH